MVFYVEMRKILQKKVFIGMGMTNRFLLFVSLFFVLGCGRSQNGSAQTNEQAVPVTTVTVEAKDVPVTFEYVALTQSSRLVNIQARVNGFLDKRVYTEGEVVHEGQVLFLMDKKPFQVQVDAAQAALARQKAASETARLNLARVKPLTELNALSQKDLDDAIGTFETSAASVNQATAQLETALLNLSYCTITSPLNGITSAALQQDGSYINMADSKLATVAALTPIWVNFSLSAYQLQNYRNQIAKGLLLPPKNDEYEIRVILIDGSLFPHVGRITFTEPFFNSQTGTFLIRASVDNPDGILRPNQYVQVRVEGALRPNAILIPQRAVQQSARGHFVWVVESDGKVHFRPVEVGDWHGEDWFITQGLFSGELVVVDGGINLHPGDRVKITPPKTKDSND